jgi:hypothetical protein
MILEVVTLNDLKLLLAEWTAVSEAAVKSLESEKPDPKLIEHGWKLEDAKTLLDTLKTAKQELDEEEKDPNLDHKAAFIASGPTLSWVQTMMQQGYQTYQLTEEGQGETGISNTTLSSDAKPSEEKLIFGGEFEEPGIKYLTEGAKAVAWRKLKGRHPFSFSRPVFKLAEKARLVLVGDWGTGIERAQKVAQMMQRSLAEKPGIQHHVIHLGDIYFSGWPKECQEHFLDHWPTTPPPALYHWCINGNHDMYCGGQGYFETVLGDGRFAAQKGCSHFCLENEHWQLIGLDTAYQEWTFALDEKTLENNPGAQGQIAWAAEQVQRKPNARRILMSHHQPLSAWESVDKAAKLATEARPLLQDSKLAAWLWGHEHRCAIYEPKTFASGGKLPFGACLGHGGVPCNPTSATKPAPHAADAPVKRVLNDADGYHKVLWEKFGLMGCAVLDLDGASAKLTFLHEPHNLAGRPQPQPFTYSL